MKMNFSHKKRFIILNICLVFISVFLIFLFGHSFSLPTGVKTIHIFSENSDYESQNPGSFKIEKSGEWIDRGKARITFDVDTVMKTNNQYTDIIFVLDVSGSMGGDKLDRVKSDTVELLNTLLSNSNNRAALITFDTDSNILSGFSNHKEELIQLVNNLSDGGTTNYYEALINVDNILKGYEKEEDREVVVLFLTDGYPCEDTPNEVSYFPYLKSQYPYITINGIQYEMGNEVLDPIKKVSDNQFIADMNTLNNVLFDASVVPKTYSKFEIIDYLNDDFFSISSVDEIKTSIGNAVLKYEGDTPKIIWDLGSGIFRSGSKAIMTIDVSLKEQYIDNDKEYFPTNKKEEISSSIEGNEDENIISTDTPILVDNYRVIYEGNAPSNCVVHNIPTSSHHSVFTQVEISNSIPTCDGYQFKGYEIINKNVKTVGDDHFVMPGEDVIIRATWSFLGLTKSMNGTVSKVQTMYKVLADQAVLDNVKSEFVSSNTGINFGSTSSNTNGKGVYQLSSTKDDTYPVYYYRGEVANNNVLFGGYCWKAVRTTSTGGVKLIYNGLPNENNECLNTTGTKTQLEVKSKFNEKYNSPAYNGYMYGDSYSYSAKNIYWYSSVKSSNSYTFLNSRSSSSYTYYYSDDISWNGSSYSLVNKDGSEVVKTPWKDNYESLKGKYRCSSGSSTTCSTIYYVAAVSSSSAYTISLTGGKLLNDVNINFSFSESVIYENGIYTLVSPTTISVFDWYDRYQDFKNYYVCPNGESTCTDVRFVVKSSSTSMDYILMSQGETYETVSENSKNSKWIYGNDVVWDGTNYTLTNTLESSPVDWLIDNENIFKGYHYTCFTTGSSCEKVYYMYYRYVPSGNDPYPYYITLTNGDTIEKAMEKMKTNTNDSTIKIAIDSWYENNLIDYADFLEDTVWCNDRSIYSGGWTKDGDATGYLYYSPYNRASNLRKPDLSCSNINDSFTVSETNGNGKLKYPISLLTADEIMLAGGRLYSSNSKYYLYTSKYWWALSPIVFNNNFAYEFNVPSNGGLYNYSVGNTYGVRPSVSLKPGILVNGGDGTDLSPYTLELD